MPPAMRTCSTVSRWLSTLSCSWATRRFASRRWDLSAARRPSESSWSCASWSPTPWSRGAPACPPASSIHPGATRSARSWWPSRPSQPSTAAFTRPTCATKARRCLPPSRKRSPSHPRPGRDCSSATTRCWGEATGASPSGRSPVSPRPRPQAWMCCSTSIHTTRHRQPSPRSCPPGCSRAAWQ